MDYAPVFEVSQCCVPFLLCLIVAMKEASENITLVVHRSGERLERSVYSHHLVLIRR